MAKRDVGPRLLGLSSPRVTLRSSRQRPSLRWLSAGAVAFLPSEVSAGGAAVFSSNGRLVVV
jgi:hypothetical protein